MPLQLSASVLQHDLPQGCIAGRTCYGLGETQLRQSYRWQLVQQFCSEGSHLVLRSCTMRLCLRLICSTCGHRPVLWPAEAASEHLQLYIDQCSVHAERAGTHVTPGAAVGRPAVRSSRCCALTGSAPPGGAAGESPPAPASCRHRGLRSSLGTDLHLKPETLPETCCRLAKCTPEAPQSCRHQGQATCSFWLLQTGEDLSLLGVACMRDMGTMFKDQIPSCLDGRQGSQLCCLASGCRMSSACAGVHRAKHILCCPATDLRSSRSPLLAEAPALLPAGCWLRGGSNSRPVTSNSISSSELCSPSTRVESSAQGSPQARLA